MAWTDEMVEDLKKMWHEGLTTGEIGKRLGVSKNSIVGKVHRLSLSGRPSPIKKKDDTESNKKVSETVEKEAPVKAVKTPKEEKTAPKIKAEKHSEAHSEKEEKVEAVNPLDRFEQYHSRNKKAMLTDLDNHTCRWPLGDPKDENFHFCGKKVKIGQTYCDEHSAIAYVKTSKK